MSALCLVLCLAAAASARQQRGSTSGQIYWSAYNAVWRANLDGSSAHQIIELPEARPPTDSTGIDDLAVGGGFIYWDSGGTVGRMALDGSGARAMTVTANGGPAHWLRLGGGNLYWDASGSDKEDVERSTVGGRGVRSLVVPPNTSGTLRGFTISGSHLFWLGVVTDPQTARQSYDIETAALDGSGATQVLALTRAQGTPQDLEVSSGYLFWLGLETHAIYRANMDGSNIRRIARSAYEPFALSVAGGRVYWASLHWQGQVVHDTVSSVGLAGGPARVVLRRDGGEGRPGVSALLVTP